MPRLDSRCPYELVAFGVGVNAYCEACKRTGRVKLRQLIRRGDGAVPLIPPRRCPHCGARKVWVQLAPPIGGSIAREAEARREAE